MRSDLFATFLLVKFDGVTFEPIVDEMDGWSGGSWSIDGKMYYPPGAIFPVNRGGLAEVDSGDVTREWQPGRDDILWSRLNAVPNADIRVTRHNRRPDKSIVLTPFAIYDGKLAGLNPPDHDSQSADDANLVITLGPSGPVGGGYTTPQA